MGTTSSAMTSHHASFADLEDAALEPIVRPGRLYWFIAAQLGLLVLIGVIAGARQLRDGLGVTGLNNRVSWATYEANIVYFIGLGYGGAVTSAILRLTNAPWRAPLTRLAEAMALVTLAIGSLFPILHLGRPDRVFNMMIHAQVGSPLVWDMVAISTYMAATIVFLYLPLIPDLALCRDRLGPVAGNLRRALYQVLSLGWEGTPAQKRILERNMTIVAVVIIPLAVSVHSVLAWLFAMNSRAGWNSTIYGPYFVIAALYSGVATVILVVAGFRHAYRLHPYIGPQHFKYLANIMLVLGLAYCYFTAAEFLTEGYKMEGFGEGEGAGSLLDAMLLGRYAPLFWGWAIVGMALPLGLIMVPRTRTAPWIVIASAIIVVGMWVKRLLIVVPPMANPIMPTEWASYWPSVTELSITMAGMAAVPLGLMIFFRLFPILSVYEIEEVAEAAHGSSGHGTVQEG